MLAGKGVVKGSDTQMLYGGEEPHLVLLKHNDVGAHETAAFARQAHSHPGGGGGHHAKLDVLA